MTATDIDWDLVRSVAISLGASRVTTYKWRQRQTIPHHWRRLIVTKSGGAISWKQIEDMDRARNAA
jgi:hypothetical protein